MRILYYVPIIHTEADYGILGPKITQAIERRLGSAIVGPIETKVHNDWKLVRERILKEIKDFQGLLIYQDSLPVGEEEKILKLFEYMVRDIPKSLNLLLIKELLEKGAILVGTEDMALVKEQVDIYLVAAKILDPWDSKESWRKMLKELLKLLINAMFLLPGESMKLCQKIAGEFSLLGENIKLLKN